MRRSLASFLLPLLAVPTFAHAQPGAAAPAPDVVPVAAVPAVAAPGTVAPGAPAAAAATPVDPAPALTGIAAASANDAASDRAYFARTALVAPSGTVTLSARAPLAPVAFSTLAVSLSDRVEVGVGTAMVIEEGGMFTGYAKLQLLRSKTAALALTLDVAQVDDEQIYWPQLVASWCSDGETCNSLVSLHLNALGVSGEDEMPVIGGVSWSTGKKTRLVTELHVHHDGERDETLLLGYAGGRFGNSKVAVDAGIAFGMFSDGNDCDGCGSDTEAVPYPFVGFSARL